MPGYRLQYLKSLSFGIFFLSMFLNVNSQEDQEIAKWMSMNLEELSQVRLVSVTLGKKSLSTRESPGIITLITAAEIEKSGARDLIDLLRMVPGFDFAVDTESSIGLGVRGNWAYEGKVLVMVDDQEMNELLYATFLFGNHIPIAQIERIEIIRGPGSSIYGGFAELAVVNIVTKKMSGMKKLELTAQYGQMSRAYARRSMTLVGGNQFGELQVNLGITAEQGRKSQLTYRDFKGSAYDMVDNSGISSLFINLGASYKRLKTRYILDHYTFQQRDAFEGIYPVPIRYVFQSHYFETRYEIPILKTFKLTPRINYTYQRPWNSTDEQAISLDDFYKVSVDRLKISLNLSGDISPQFFINSSIMQYFDKGEILGETADADYFNGKKVVNYNGFAWFLQSFIKTPLISFSAGLRYDHHNLYRDSLVPWIGLNKVYKQVYFKFLFGQTFRVPSISNISLSRNIQAEKSIEFDMEVGYQFTSSFIMSFNVFSTGIRNAIVYRVDPETEAEFYHNSGHTGTLGGEMELLFKGNWGHINANYSYYQAKKETLEEFSVPGNDNLFLAFPAHKVAISSNILLNSALSFNPSLVYYSQRFGYQKELGMDEPMVTRFEPVVMLNCFFRYQNVLDNLDVGMGIYDLFDSGYRYIQPYNGGHAPLPGSSREILLRLTYRID